MKKLTYSSIGLCVVCFVCSLCFSGHAEIVFLALSVLFMTEVLLAAVFKARLNAKLFAAMFWCNLCGQLSFAIALDVVSSVFFLVGMGFWLVIGLRFVYYMNKYCGRDAERLMEE